MKMKEEVVSPGFEGPEKKLEVDFRTKHGGTLGGREGFRRVTRGEWDILLEKAQCTIVSVISNAHCDAYLLSESSLFVYPHKVLIKTCGTTTLLRAVPLLLDIADRLEMQLDFLQYSRASFKYPNKQLYPHNSFENEVEFLDEYFPHGESYVLGTGDGATEWHVYIADNAKSPSREQSMEVFMFELDPKAMKQFMFGTGSARIGSEAGLDTAESSGTKGILDHAARESKCAEELIVDAFNFDPCGFSLNALVEDIYFTIHVTPETHCSYVSFECNAPVGDFTGILGRVLDVFRPRKFAVGILAEMGAPTSMLHVKNPLDWNAAAKFGSGYRHSGDATFLRMGTHYDYCASLCSYVPRTDKETGKPVGSGQKLTTSSHCLSSLHDIASRLNAKRIVRSSQEELVRTVLDQRDDSMRLNPRHGKPVFLVDLSMVHRRLALFTEVFGRNVSPRTSVESSSDAGVVAILALAGSQFEVTSAMDLRTVLTSGVRTHCSDFILDVTSVTANTMKKVSNLSECVVLRLPESTSSERIRKSATIFPGAPVEVVLSDPIDGDLEDITQSLRATFQEALEVGLRPCAIALELSGSCAHPDMFRKVAARAHALSAWMRRASNPLRKAGVRLEWIHIDGDYPGFDAQEEETYRAAASVAARTITEYFPEVGGPRVFLDPSRFVLGPSRTLVVSIVGRGRRECSESPVSYIINDGFYGSLAQGSPEGAGMSAPIVVRPRKGSKLPCTLFGPTGDVDLDKLWQGSLPPLEMNDCLLFTNMGTSGTHRSVGTEYFVVE